MRIYCDTSALGVEFNDQQNLKNRGEAAAMRLVFALAEYFGWEFADSWHQYFEIGHTQPRSRRVAMRAKLRGASRYIRATEARSLSLEMTNIGFPPKDAAHLAAALLAECDVLLTCDGEFHDLAKQHAKILRLKVRRPSELVAEAEYGKK